MTTDLATTSGTNTPAPIETLDTGAQVMVLKDQRVNLIRNENPYAMFIVQPGTLQKRPELQENLGQFMFQGIEGLSFPKLRLLPIRVHMEGLVLQPPYDANGDNQAICKSYDRLKPAGNVESPIAPECGYYDDKGRYIRTCPKNIWDDGKKECRDLVVVSFLDIDSKLPVQFWFRGKALSAWKKWKDEQAAVLDLAPLRGDDPNDYVLEMSTRMAGTYYEPVLKMVAAKEDNPAQYVPLIDYYRDKFSWEDNGPADSRGAVESRPVAETVDNDEDGDIPEGEGGEAIQSFDV